MTLSNRLGLQALAPTSHSFSKVKDWGIQSYARVALLKVPADPVGSERGRSVSGGAEFSTHRGKEWAMASESVLFAIFLLLVVLHQQGVPAESGLDRLGQGR